MTVCREVTYVHFVQPSVAVVQEQFVPKDPPAQYEFIADPPSISAYDLDVVSSHVLVFIRLTCVFTNKKLLASAVPLETCDRLYRMVQIRKEPSRCARWRSIAIHNACLCYWCSGSCCYKVLIFWIGNARKLHLVNLQACLIRPSDKWTNRNSL